ncbi:MAG: TetR/AcrR family transcriptional regulator [Alphaproteobacteria bacterium]|nr:TetR/AcrR family transcriptional regulator [Alphaproteobacteria bacterium]
MTKNKENKAKVRKSRKQVILDVAAKLFSQKGFHALSIRDIAKEAGILPGSLYYHFSSKEELLYSVYSEGVMRIASSVDKAIASKQGSWEKLAAACCMHLEMLLDQSHYAQVVVKILPDESSGIRDSLVLLRNEYENRFKVLINDLEMVPDINRKYVRLFLLTSLNSAPTWYRPGIDKPKTISKEFINIIKKKTELNRTNND